MPKRQFAVAGLISSVLGVLAITLPSPLCAQQAAHGISAANLVVVQNDAANTTNSVTVTTSLSINGFSMRDGSNRGDYNVQIGVGFSDDISSGVLLTSIAQNGRDNGEIAEPGINYCTSGTDYSRSGAMAGAYFIPVFNAPGGSEYNINVAAAFFSYDQWIGGYARNSGVTNGGNNNLFTASSGLGLGVHFVDQGDGVSKVNLTSLGIDSRTDGVLLVTHGRNEDNYALSFVNTNDGTWTVYVKDNGSEGVAREQDPVAFVYVPRTNATVISGRFRGDGIPLLFSGATPQFSVTNLSIGNWRLTIPGHSPTTGVLILSPEGGTSQNQDNIVSYQADGDGWIIQSRDLPDDPPNLQTPSGPVASFVFVPAPLTMTLISPQADALGLGASPTLQMSVSNDLPGNLTLEIFGRKAAPVPGADFALALLPDTQFYTAGLNGGHPDMFQAQTEWIITNRVARNIAYVAHLGDISQNGDLRSGNSNLAEWRNATNAMYRLENPARTLLEYGIPYGMAVGNHDQEPIGTANGTTTFYNQFFGISHFDGRPYYAGHYGTNNDNHFDFFSASGLDFVVLYFEFDSNANPDVLAWGNEVLRTNAHRRAIVVTHNFGNTQTPLTFSAQGAAIYNALRTNENLFLMLAGHVTGEGSRVDTFNGNVVRTFVQDFQGWTNGGNGFMRTMDFSPSNNQVVVQTFSPWTGEYETDANSEFFFDYDMQLPSTPFERIGVLSNVPPGNLASFVWPNREPSTAYEWYVVAKVATGNATTGPVWRFSTGTNSPPITANELQTVTGDQAAHLTFSASDANGDQITFQTNSHPNHGLVSNFVPTTGTITYQPAHGFRGLDQISYFASDSAATSAVVNLYLNVVAPSDIDGDGLPDAWEAKHGVNFFNADDDGDGQNNLAEYLANTNPTNAASLLRFTEVIRSEIGHATLQWSSIGSTRYRIQFSNGGANGSFNGVFTDIVRPLALEMDSASDDSPSTQSFVDDFTLTGSSTNGVRYYRIKVVP